ncbi:Crp/Fnr family transcriptional regulator [Rhabdaerophilum calidifontis]|uniref:Crp/Fnr family transcriptional regulator n=1 Tax=Rhabdaerophilum calidifontis TaxID=2604328 RepID=UPI0012392FD0|nr:Crp/Fnr family transcriptional regulator [Rhabdaerophilum calidifontis]
MQRAADRKTIGHVADRLALAGAAREEFGAAARLHRFPSGMTVIRPGDPAQGYLYILDGAVRMQLVGARGRVVTLLRIERDEPCVLTTSCLFSRRPYPVEGVTEGEVTALTLPVAVFDWLFAEAPGFRAAVLRTFSERVGDIIVAMEASLFDSVPARLARALIGAAREGIVHLTHAELAAEIGSAREVVSRQLARFAERGLISLQRGTIEIRAAEALRREAESGI